MALFWRAREAGLVSIIKITGSFKLWSGGKFFAKLSSGMVSIRRDGIGILR